MVEVIIVGVGKDNMVTKLASAPSRKNNKEVSEIITMRNDVVKYSKNYFCTI